jgi:hypothetical protein
MSELTTKFITPTARLSYVYVVTPRKSDDGSERYQCTVLIPKADTGTIAKIKGLVDNAKKKDAAKIAGNGGVKNPLLDGDAKIDGEFQYSDESVRGHFFLRCASPKKPEIVDKNLDEIIDPREIYSGMWGKVSINFYGWKNSTGRGIGAGLGNIQKVKDGEAFSGGARAKDEFSAVEDDFLS